MKRFIFLLVLLIAAVWFGLKISEDPGYALFVYQHWTVEMPLWFFVAALIVGVIVCHWIFQMLKSIGGLGGAYRGWSSKRTRQKANDATNQGLLELAEGKWGSAEKLLMKALGKSEVPLINYLAAARAAQEQGAYSRRDDYLRDAHKQNPEADVAIGLTQAQLQFHQGKYEHSLATLRHLQTVVPHHVFVLKLLQKVYVGLNDWDGLLALMPELVKRKVIVEGKALALKKQAYEALLTQDRKDYTAESLVALWKSVPRSLQHEESLLLPYVQQLRKTGLACDAEVVLRDAIKREWSHPLVRLYGEVESANLSKQLSVAESWLKAHDKDPVLLLCLGRLSVSNQLWGKAKEYLSASIEFQKTSEACIAMAKLLEQIGEAEEAMDYYRQASS